MNGQNYIVIAEDRVLFLEEISAGIYIHSPTLISFEMPYTAANFRELVMPEPKEVEELLKEPQLV